MEEELQSKLTESKYRLYRLMKRGRRMKQLVEGSRNWARLRGDEEAALLE